ncbi:MAG: KH domain-containing protein [Bacilli bacterium]|nr:KH domain-containing protein [Bacilli bacterium]
MKKYTYEGKTYDEVKEKALSELKVNEEDLIIINKEEKSSLLKKTAKIEVTTINDVQNYIKETISEILKLMGIETNFEVRRRDKSISIKLFSNNNAILIGKNGRTIGALQTIIRQIVSNQINEKLSILLDVENYKEKKEKNIEYLAKKTAREVAKTKVEVTMDSMNSYERRIVHSVLADDKYVYTESIGEEPNRCVVIKLKEEIK